MTRGATTGVSPIVGLGGIGVFVGFGLGEGGRVEVATGVRVAEGRGVGDELGVFVGRAVARAGVAVFEGAAVGIVVGGIGVLVGFAVLDGDGVTVILEVRGSGVSLAIGVAFLTSAPLTTSIVRSAFAIGLGSVGGVGPAAGLKGDGRSSRCPTVGGISVAVSSRG